jgi:hypothetical protein
LTVIAMVFSSHPLERTRIPIQPPFRWRDRKGRR